LATVALCRQGAWQDDNSYKILFSKDW